MAERPMPRSRRESMLFHMKTSTIAKIVACLIPITLGASIAIGVQAHRTTDERGIPTVAFPRTEPCSTCGQARPVMITCDDLNWYITQPGWIPDVAATVCDPGSTFTWELK